MKYLRKFEKKLILFGGLTLLVIGLLIPILSRNAFAAGLLVNRTIEMSSSAANASSVTYTIAFKTATAGAIEGIVIEFCDNNPLINTACTYTGGQSINTSSTALSSIAGPSDTTTGDWSVTNASGLIILYDASSSTSVGAGVQVTIIMTGFQNPNYSSCAGGTVPNCSFYARLLTYTTTWPHTNPYAATTIGTPTDEGGIALSTNQAITVTSKVQEQLTFCVYTGANCAAGGGSVILGDTQGVLYTSGPFVDKSTTYTISTNAINGLTVRMLGNTLTSGSNTINAIGGTAASSASGTSQFGLCSYVSASTAMTLTITSPYNNAACNTTTQSAGPGQTGTPGGNGTAQFAFDTTQTTTTYGASLASASAGSSAGSATGVIAMIGNTSVTQQAGLYSTTLTFVCTATY